VRRSPSPFSSFAPCERVPASKISPDVQETITIAEKRQPKVEEPNNTSDQMIGHACYIATETYRRKVQEVVTTTQKFQRESTSIHCHRFVRGFMFKYPSLTDKNPWSSGRRHRGSIRIESTRGKGRSLREGPTRQAPLEIAPDGGHQFGTESATWPLRDRVGPQGSTEVTVGLSDVRYET
jgi:hypothetical protein